MEIKVTGRTQDKRSSFSVATTWDGTGLQIRIDDRNNDPFFLNISVHYDLMKLLMARIEEARPKCSCNEPFAEECLEARGGDDAVMITDGLRECACRCHFEDEDGETEWERGAGDLRDLDPDYPERIARLVAGDILPILNI